MHNQKWNKQGYRHDCLTTLIFQKKILKNTLCPEISRDSRQRDIFQPRDITGFFVLKEQLYISLDIIIGRYPCTIKSETNKVTVMIAWPHWFFRKKY